MIKKKKARKIVKKETGLALTPKYHETVKFNSWVRHFFNIKDTDTYGNATKSALRVYNTEDYHGAGVIGHENLKKLKILSVAITDQLGYGLADLIKIGLSKIMTGEYDDWDKFMVRLGYFQPEQKQTLIQNNFDLSGLGEAINQSRAERGLQPV